MASHCPHGCSFSDSEQRKAELVQECRRFHLAASPDRGLQASRFAQFWSAHSDMIDKELYSVYFALATDELLDGKLDLAHGLTFEGIQIKQLAENGNNPFSERFGQGLGRHMSKISTPQGLIRYLAKSIPCACLDHLITRGIAQCCNCFTDVTKTRLYKCGACKMVNYCSKECQTAHWEDHKSACRRMHTGGSDRR